MRLCRPQQAGGHRVSKRCPCRLPCVPLSCCRAGGLAGLITKQRQSITFLPCSAAAKEKSQSHLGLLSTYANKRVPSAGHLCHSIQPITYLCHGDTGMEQQICTVVKVHPMVPEAPCAKGISVLQHEHGLASTS